MDPQQSLANFSLWTNPGPLLVLLDKVLLEPCPEIFIIWPLFGVWALVYTTDKCTVFADSQAAPRMSTGCLLTPGLHC